MVSINATIRISYDLIIIQKERSDYYNLAGYSMTGDRAPLIPILHEIKQMSDYFGGELRDTISRFDGEAKRYEGKRRGVIYTIWNENKGELYNKNAMELISAIKNEHRLICGCYERALQYSQKLEPAVAGLFNMQLTRLRSALDSFDNIRDTISDI